MVSLCNWLCLENIFNSLLDLRSQLGNQLKALNCVDELLRP